MIRSRHLTNHRLASCLLLPTVLALTIACFGDDDETPDPGTPVHSSTATATVERAAEATATPLVEAPEPPPAYRAPVMSLDTLDVLARGEDVPFKVCSQQTGWAKPGPEEMAPVFQDRRFGDGVAPFPQDYTYYLRDFYFPYTFSASGNKYFTAFGGFGLTEGKGPPVETFCDLADVTAMGTYRRIRTVDHRVTAVKHLGNHVVIEVEPGFDGWQETVYPYPPVHPVFTDDGVQVIRVVNADGATLFEEDRSEGGEAWFQWVQYRPEGALDYLILGGILPYASTEIEISEGQPALRIYSSNPPVPYRDGSLVAIDEHGIEAARIEWSGEHGFWQSLGWLSLEPGRYTLRFEDEARDWRHFVLLAADVPLPPNATHSLRPESLPDASAILASGDEVPFQVCHVVSNWQRPGQGDMAHIYANPRFGDGALPFPLYYATYLERAYYVAYPTAISANIERNAFNGFWAPGDVEQPCEAPDTAALIQQYGAPAKSDKPFYQTLELVGYHALEMRRQGADLAVVVEPAPGTRETAYFPYPADPGFFEAAIGFESVQVVDTEHRPVHLEARVSEAAWWERMQYAEDGQLDVVVLLGDDTFSTTALEVPAGQDRITLYGGLGAPHNATPAGRLTALDAGGGELLSIEWDETDVLWEALGVVDLPPETTRLRIETRQIGPLETWFPFVLIRDGLPLPTGVQNVGE